MPSLVNVSTDQSEPHSNMTTPFGLDGYDGPDAARGHSPDPGVVATNLLKEMNENGAPTPV